MKQANQITSPGNLNWEIWRTQTSYQSVTVDQKVMSWQERRGQVWWTTSRQKMLVSGEKKAEQISGERNRNSAKLWEMRRINLVKSTREKQIINAPQLPNSPTPTQGTGNLTWPSLKASPGLATKYTQWDETNIRLNIHVPRRFGSHVDLISKVLGGGASWRWLGRGGSDSWMRLVPTWKRPQGAASSPSTRWGRSKKTAVKEPESKLSPDTEPAITLILDLLPPDSAK